VFAAARSLVTTPPPTGRPRSPTPTGVDGDGVNDGAAATVTVRTTGRSCPRTLLNYLLWEAWLEHGMPGVRGPARC
jgi:hypothetical protein